MDGTTQIIARTIRTKKATGHRGEINSQELRHSRNDSSLFFNRGFFFFTKVETDEA